MKITMVFILCVLTFGGLVSCSEETELRWENKETTNSSSVYDIQWLPDGGNSVDTTWSGELAQDQVSSFKEVGVTTGKGVCTDNADPNLGTEYDIFVNGDDVITLDSGSNTLTITTLQTK